MRISIKAVLAVFLWLVCGLNSYGDRHDRLLCDGNYTNLNQWPVVQKPKRVLLIPLLSKNLESENERWPERPAALLADFYHRQFHAQTVWLRNIHNWDDYYRAVDRLLPQQAASFDRIILIGHGGFDGPVLKQTEILQNLTIKGSQGVVNYVTEIQAGKQDTFSLTYDTTKNRVFNDYVARHWRDLVQKDSDEVTRLLNETKKRLLPLDNACFERYCAHLRPDPFNPEDQTIQKIKFDTCDDICRGPLFVLKSEEEINPDRFYLFAKSLNSLARKDGLIFFGECNPGTKVPYINSYWEDPAFLSQSHLVGGPFKTYLHMFANASGRVTAGPIGESSADDIVRRIISLETHRHQHYLCITAPATACSNGSCTATRQ